METIILRVDNKSNAKKIYDVLQLLNGVKENEKGNKSACIQATTHAAFRNRKH
jgi:hypothetical protein